MVKFLMILSAFCFSSGLQGHQPDLSSIILAEQGENKWVLQVRSALTAFEYVVEEKFGPSAYATPEEFQQLVVDYLRAHISIEFNGANKAVLENGMVKLGHETNVVFQLQGTPEMIHSLAVENKSFQYIARNKGILIVYKEGFSKDQFTLNDDNGHRIALKVGTNKFEAVEPEPLWKPLHFLLLAIGILAIPIILIRYKNRPYFNPSSSLLERV